MTWVGILDGGDGHCGIDFICACANTSRPVRSDVIARAS